MIKKPRHLNLRQDHPLQRNMETRRGTRHSTFVTKTTPEQLETEFCHAISTTFLRTLGADDRTPTTRCTTSDPNNANPQWSSHLVSNSTNTSTEPSHGSPQPERLHIVHRSVGNYGPACVGPASETARN